MKLSKDYLLKAYVKQKKSIKVIQQEKNCGSTTIYRCLEYYNIKFRKYGHRDNKGNSICQTCNSKISYYAKECKSCSKRGDQHPKWKGGKRIREDGYILIYKPEHPNKTSECYVLEHRLVMEDHLGRYLNSKEVVHHIDGNRGNNKLSNLMLFPDLASHMKFRHLNDKSFICKHCGKNQKGDYK